MTVDPRLIAVGTVGGCSIGVGGAAEGENQPVEDGRCVAVEHVESLVEKNRVATGGDDYAGGVWH